MNLSDLHQPIYSAEFYTRPDWNQQPGGLGNISWDLFNQGSGQRYESANLMQQRQKDIASQDALAAQKRLQTQQEVWLSGIETEYPNLFNPQQPSSTPPPQPGQNQAIDDLYGYIDQLMNSVNSQQQQIQQGLYQQQYQQGTQPYQPYQPPQPPAPTHNPYILPQNLVGELYSALDVFAGGIDQIQQIFGQQGAQRIDALRQPIYQAALAEYQRTGNLDRATQVAVGQLMAGGGELIDALGLNADVMNSYDASAWQGAMTAKVKQLLGGMLGG